MNIQTRFNEGDYIWVMDRIRLVERRVTFISWNSRGGVTYEVFTGDDTYAAKSFHEKLCFETKDELIKSL